MPWPAWAYLAGLLLIGGGGLFATGYYNETDGEGFVIFIAVCWPLLLPVALVWFVVQAPLELGKYVHKRRHSPTPPELPELAEVERYLAEPAPLAADFEPSHRTTLHT